MNSTAIGPALRGDLPRILEIQKEAYLSEAACAELFTGVKSARNLSLYQRRGYARVREFELPPRVTAVCLRKQAAPAGGAPEPHSAKA